MKNLISIIVVFFIISSFLYIIGDNSIIINIINHSDSVKEYLVYNLEKNEFKNLDWIKYKDSIDNYYDIKKLESYIIKNNLKESRKVVINKYSKSKVKLVKSKYLFIEKNKKSISFIIANNNEKIINVYPKFISDENKDIDSYPEEKLEKDLDLKEREYNIDCDYNKKEVKVDQKNKEQYRRSLPKTGISMIFKILEVAGFIILILGLLILIS